MIKKNLFLLVSFYFFVLQSIFVWLLRDISNFYWLALINFVFILFLAIISKNTEVKKWIKTQNTVVKTDVAEKNTIEKLEKIKKLQKKKIYKSISHVWLFIISALAWFFVWFWLSNMDVYFQLIISVVWSFLLFFVFSFLFKFQIKKVWETKVYTVILLWLLVIYAVTSIDIKMSDITNVFSSNVDVESELVSLTWDVDFVPVDWDLITWDLIWDSKNLEDTEKEAIEKEDTEKEKMLVDFDKKATFTDVIKSLFDENGVVLNTSKNIKFTYVPYTDSDYDYFRTAYDKKMIWKTTIPTKTLLCETYIVMKWLTEWRNVWSYKNIKTAYWNYAKNNNKLSDCKYGEYTKLWDLK